MQLQPGDSVAGWVIQQELSSGAMGVTYLAQHPRLPRLDVVKVIHSHLASNDDFRHRFLREADVIAQLQHPHVVTIHDRGEDNGQLYIAMQYVPGGDLRGWLTKDGTLPLRTALVIADQLAAALDMAHEQGIVHRDVKPENVLLLRASVDDPYAVLADFGIARSQTSTALTADGSVLATPGYAAPEQVEGKMLGGATDQYALACVLFEMLAGRIPFPRDTATAALIAHVTDPPPDLSTVAPQSPVVLDAVVRRALAKAPEERFPSCRDFVTAARAAVTDADQGTAVTDTNATVSMPAVTPSGELPPTPDAKPGRRFTPRRLVAAGVLLVLGGGIGAAIGLTGSSAKSSGHSANPNTATTIVQPSNKRGGTLQLAYATACSFDPQVVNDSDCLALQELVSRQLLAYAPKPGPAKLIPDLAEAVPTSIDERTWTYRLKRGLRFEDGTPITSADIKYGLERSFAPLLNGGAASYALRLLQGAANYPGPYASDKGLDSIATPDDRTITFHLARPFRDWNYVMASALSTPVPKAKDAYLFYGLHPVASGPYKLKSAVSSTGVVLVRNRYWNQASDPSSAALPEQIDVKVSSDDTGIQAALANGGADYAPQSPATGPVMADAAGDPALARRLDTVTGYSTYLLTPVTAVKPLDNPHCRMAVAWAVNRQAYQLRATGRDAGPVTTRIMPPPYAEGTVANPFPGAGSDTALKHARAELALCGHPKGFTTKLGYFESTGGGAQALSDSLAEVGIIATPSALTDIGTPETLNRQHYGLLVTNWGPDWPAPYAFFEPLVGSRAITAHGNSNLGQIRDSNVDDDIAAGLDATTPQARATAWLGLESYLLKQAFIVPLTVSRTAVLRSSRLTNVYVSQYLTQYNLASLGVVP
jgi:peptide/nickel transport system substrate-binding protein